MMKNSKSPDLNMISEGLFTLNKQTEKFDVKRYLSMSLMRSSNVLLRAEYENHQFKSRNALLTGIDITSGQLIGKMFIDSTDHLHF